MRESLYGLDDNGEQRSASADGGSAAAVGAANACSSGAAEPWGEPWGAANAGAAAGENPRQQWEAAAQQQPWDIAAGERSARRRTRAGGSTRLGRRRQQAEQAAEHAKTAAGEEGEEEEEAAEAAAGPSVPPLEDPWVDAELRQLRRRQRAAARRGDQASAGGPLPDPWAAEWGPVVSPADVAAATEDFGWAAESWAGDGAGAGRERRQRERRQQQHEDEEEAGAGPGSAWDLAQEQRELRRRRRRQRAAAAGGADAQAAAAYDQQHQQQWGYNGPSGAQQQQQQQRQAAGFDAAAGGTSDPPLGDFEFKDNDDELRWGAGGVGGEFSGAYEPGLTVEPDVALLSTGARGGDCAEWCVMAGHDGRQGAGHGAAQQPTAAPPSPFSLETCLLHPPLQMSWSESCRWCPSRSRRRSLAAPPPTACSAGARPWRPPSSCQR